MASNRTSTMSPTIRQSPFQRQPSNSPAPGSPRASTPTQTGGRPIHPSSPLRPGPLSPEKHGLAALRQSQANGSNNDNSPVPPSPSAIARQMLRSVEPQDRRQENLMPTAVVDFANNSVQSKFNQLNQNSSVATTPTRPSTKHTVYGQLPSNTSQGSLINRANNLVTNDVSHKSPISHSSPTKQTKQTLGTSSYQQIPAALLRSMRESFEVIDSSNKGVIDSASVASMLDQMGLDNTPAALREFFPPTSTGQLNLAKYLDTISSPLVELSQTDELAAAFEAFDVDDSGQIDIAELRKALLNCGIGPGNRMSGLSEAEIDKVLGDFTGRRAFGGKGVTAAKARGDVFKYKDFMNSVTGAGLEVTHGDVVAT